MSHFYHGNIPITNFDFNPYIFPSHTNFPVRKHLIFNNNIENPEANNRSGTFKSSDNGDFFAYEVDICGFRPEEIDIIVEGDEVLINAKHEDLFEKESVFHELKRRFKIPEKIRKESIYCQVNNSGHLQITGSELEKEEERLTSWINFRRESLSPERSHGKGIIGKFEDLDLRDRDDVDEEREFVFAS